MVILHYIWDNLSGHFQITGYRIYWAYVLSAAAIGVGVYVWQAQRDWSFVGGLKSLFPKEVNLMAGYGLFRQINLRRHCPDVDAHLCADLCRVPVMHAIINAGV